MKLIFLGTGSAFTIGNYQSNMLLEDDNGKRLLIDCGSDIRFSLDAVGIRLGEITDVYISHIHADHMGGLEGLAFSTFFNPACEKPNLYISSRMRVPLWYSALSGGLSCLKDTEVTMETYFNVVEDNNQKFTWSDTEFALVPTIHVYDVRAVKPSYGLMFNTGKNNVFITTDTQFTPEMFAEEYTEADVIFHDCETSPFPSGVHAHYEQLKTLPDNIRAKMWLYHYNPGNLPNAVSDGFKGFVDKRQEFCL